MMKNFYDVCKKNKLKITPQRIEIYKKIIKNNEHPSLNKIYKRVKKKFPNISIDTTYRTLKKFVEIGIVKTLEVDENFKRYDGFTEKHHHFYCIKCHGIFDFFYKDLETKNFKKLFDEKFEINDYKITLEGICEKCK